MSTTSSEFTKGRAASPSTCKGGARMGRAAAVIEARRAEDGRHHYRAYRCGTCLQPNGTPAWHVRRLSLWRRLLTSER
ncbi:hypothetical protein CLV35_0985 [Motilibacter peucedani]|uniref:Uncharacterized protein n=1 Tax=Motilibacter peucedani TaxID=598650 RepID=A0A420XUP5_9ACTN|nr:hypothetical protein [Motilibacter peucedani]RKS80548.1 hypothetical protein CLV35_0985 [Motilibacter peucedani]